MLGYTNDDSSSFSSDITGDSSEDGSSVKTCHTAQDKKSLENHFSKISQGKNPTNTQKKWITFSAANKDSRQSSSSESLDVKVMTLEKKEDGGRLYNKKFNCVLLQAFQQNGTPFSQNTKTNQKWKEHWHFPRGPKSEEYRWVYWATEGIVAVITRCWRMAGSGDTPSTASLTCEIQFTQFTV